ncbi:Os07g0586332 [Oryza sativa Japonica Group]|uniref:Os07g0586332 protein n=1 Tax=Oryza sativa subsp. japonica TaxID=39947 RepID=A0A0P0X8E8_ORYSJ|nr:Os07g0586332 [Oryza sativa Japonica Group]
MGRCRTRCWGGAARSSWWSGPAALPSLATWPPRSITSTPSSSRINSDADEDGKPESGAIAEGCDVDRGCDDDASIIRESMITTMVNGEGNPKSPENDDGFTSASPAEAASASGFDRISVESGMRPPPEPGATARLLLPLRLPPTAHRY